MGQPFITVQTPSVSPSSRFCPKDKDKKRLYFRPFSREGLNCIPPTCRGLTTLSAWACRMQVMREGLIYIPPNCRRTRQWLRSITVQTPSVSPSSRFCPKDKDKKRLYFRPFSREGLNCIPPTCRGLATLSAFL